MNSRLCHAQVMHARRQPTRHVFRYPLYLYSLDLAELPVLDREVAWFGYNRFRPASIYDRDYLESTTDSIDAKIRRWFNRDDVNRIEILKDAAQGAVFLLQRRKS